jgi:hypothetical protein
LILRRNEKRFIMVSGSMEIGPKETEREIEVVPLEEPVPTPAPEPEPAVEPEPVPA